MKRDMDLAREILLFAEENCPGGGEARVSVDDFENTDPERDLYAHIKMLERQQFLQNVQQASGYIFLADLLWHGHNFLDSVRDPEIWKKTKEVAHKAGGFTFDILGDIAKGLIKTQVKKYTGVEI